MTRKALVWLCMSCMVVFALGCEAGSSSDSAGTASSDKEVHADEGGYYEGGYYEGGYYEGGYYEGGYYEDGREDGGREDGGHEDGGHEDGDECFSGGFECLDEYSVGSCYDGRLEGIEECNGGKICVSDGETDAYCCWPEGTGYKWQPEDFQQCFVSCLEAAWGPAECADYCQEECIDSCAAAPAGEHDAAWWENDDEDDEDDEGDEDCEEICEDMPKLEAEDFWNEQDFGDCVYSCEEGEGGDHDESGIINPDCVDDCKDACISNCNWNADGDVKALCVDYCWDIAGIEEDGESGTEEGSKEYGQQLAQATCVDIKPIEVRSGIPTIGSVAVYFSAYSCDGDGVVDLTSKDLNITEDGSPISETESQATILNRDAEAYVTLVLDNSPSVAAAGAVDDAADAAHVLVENLFLGVEETTFVSVVFFSKFFEVQLDYSNDVAAVHAAVESLKTDNSGSNTTNLNGAIIDALGASEAVQDERREAMDGGIQSIGQVVVFTDGSDQASLFSHSAAVGAVNASADDVITISFGGEVDEQALQDLGKNGSYVKDNSSELIGVFEEVASLLRGRKEAQYLLAYCTPKLAGVHNLVLEVPSSSGGSVKGTSPSIPFSAAGFAEAGPECSINTLKKACNQKSCGGLWCGGCSVQMTCAANQCVCPAQQMEDCDGGCTPSSFLGDGTCTPSLSCEEMGYDSGDCGATDSGAPDMSPSGQKCSSDGEHI